LTFIPAELSKLSHLEELKVGCNPLSSIPEEVFTEMHRLTYLDVGYGDILSTLPDSIGECASLKELWAGNNRYVFTSVVLVFTLFTEKSLCAIAGFTHFRAHCVAARTSKFCRFMETT